MRPMTNDVRKKIVQYIKNRIDISPLIKGVEIKGEDFSNAIITEFNRSGEDLSGINLSHAKVGLEGKVSNLSNCKMLNSECVGTIFLGVVYLRRCKCVGSNFNFATCTNVEWQYSDMRQCTFCETLLRLGVSYFYKAIVDLNLFQDWTKYLNINVKFKKVELNEAIEQKIMESEK